MVDAGLRGTARSTQPTADQYPERKPNRLAPPRTPAPGFSPEGGTSLPVCVSHRILARTQPFCILSMRKHLYKILRNSISILFEKHMLGLQCYHSPQCAALRDSSLSPST
jgi:hypothetical protein